MILWSFEQIQDDVLVFKQELRYRSIQGRFVEKYVEEEKKFETTILITVTVIDLCDIIKAIIMTERLDQFKTAS